jgi:hypothetical protein
MSTVHPSQIPDIVSKTGVDVMVEGYDSEAPIYQDLVEVISISPLSPPTGFREAGMAGDEAMEETARGEAAKAGTVNKTFTAYGRVIKFSKLLVLQEEEYNNPNANNILVGRVRDTARGWGAAWAALKDQLCADLFNNGALTAGHQGTFDGTPEDHPWEDPYPKFIFDGKPFLAASGNGHPLLPGGSDVRHNKLALSLSSTNLETALQLLEDTNAVSAYGQKINVRADTLLVPRALQQTAKVIVGSELVPGSANNDINTHQGLLQAVTWRRLNTSTSWAVMKRGRGIRAHDSGVLRLSTEVRTDGTGNVAIRAVGYFGRTVTDWRYIVGSNFPAS